jgi:hypothetical protein
MQRRRIISAPPKAFLISNRTIGFGNGKLYIHLSGVGKEGGREGGRLGFPGFLATHLKDRNPQIK